jgi:hypothetical protein
MSRLWAAAPTRAPARRRSRTRACSLWTSSPSLSGASSRRCASRSKTASFRWRAPKARRIFPARFTLVAAMNPCPCGNYGHPEIACICSPIALEKYRRKISGPIADRIDLWSVMGPVVLSELGAAQAGDRDRSRARARTARTRAQQKRFGTAGRTNSDLNPRELNDLVPLHPRVRGILEKAGERLALSPRAFHRVIKVARTIADLDESPDINDSTSSKPSSTAKRKVARLSRWHNLSSTSKYRAAQQKVFLQNLSRSSPNKNFLRQSKS